jgi:hypothetical protein
MISSVPAHCAGRLIANTPPHKKSRHRSESSDANQGHPVTDAMQEPAPARFDRLCRLLSHRLLQARDGRCLEAQEWLVTASTGEVSKSARLVHGCWTERARRPWPRDYK